MRRPGLPRSIALTAAIAGLLAGASAGCGRQGDLFETRAAAPPATATTRTAPATGTTPLRSATTPRPRTVTAPPAPQPTTTQPRTVTTAPPPPATTTTTRPRTVTTPAPAPDDGGGPSVSDAQLRKTAADYARRTYLITVTPKDVTLRRSRRKPRWAIASGEEGRALWVVWLRDGKILLTATDPAKFNPVAVPCDIRPAFAEPSC